MNTLCTLPKNMEPSKEAFENLGFYFKGSADSKTYWTILPDNWKLELSNPIGWINIVDPSGSSRASYDYKKEKVVLA